MRYLPPLPKDFKGLAAGAAMVLALCAFFAIFGSRGVMDLRRLNEQQADVEGVAFSLALENQRLRDHLDRLASDDRYLEKIARERLGWIKPGELVYRTTSRDSNAPASNGSTSNSMKE